MKNFTILVLTLAIMGNMNLVGQEQGIAAPDFEVNLLDGGMFRLSEQVGMVVLVYLFGNTCSFCIASGPKVEETIYNVFKENSEFTAVGLDTWDSSSNKNSVTGFRNKTGISLPLAIKAGFVAKDYSTTWDRLMVINKEGILFHKGVVATDNDIENAVTAINESLTLTNKLDTYANQFHLKLFPNPAVDVLYMEITEGRVLGIELYDITGKKVGELHYSGQEESTTIEVPLHHLRQGIYLYSIQTEGTSLSGKFIIQR